ARARRPGDSHERLVAEQAQNAGDLALTTEEARGVRLLERRQAGKRTLVLAEIERLLAGQERLERGAELLGRAEAILSALLQASIDHGAERAHVRALVAHAGHRLPEIRDL